MPSPIVYCQLSTTNYGGATRFYRELFGWRSESSNPPSPEYTELYSAGESKPIAGILPAPPTDVLSRWIPVVEVDDVEMTTQKAGELGAVVIVPPVDIPGKGKYSLIVDPTGASFAVFKPLVTKT